MARMVSYQVRPIRSSAATTRVSPPARRPFRGVPAPPLLGPCGAGDADVTEDVVAGDSGPPELVLLGGGIHAGHSLLEAAAGADVAEEGHGKQVTFYPHLPQHENDIGSGCGRNGGVSPLSPARDGSRPGLFLLWRFLRKFPAEYPVIGSR